MTQPLHEPSVDGLREELLGLVQSVKEQLLDRRALYVDIDCTRPQPRHAGRDAGGNSDESLEALGQEVMNCRNCALYKTRKNVVFGAGRARAARGRKLFLSARRQVRMRIYRASRLSAGRVSCLPTLSSKE